MYKAEVSRDTNDQEFEAQKSRNIEDQTINRSILDALNRLNMRIDALETRSNNNEKSTSEHDRIVHAVNDREEHEKKLLVIIEKQSKQIEELIAEVNALKNNQRYSNQLTGQQITQPQQINLDQHQQQQHITQQHIVRQQHLGQHQQQTAINTQVHQVVQNERIAQQQQDTDPQMIRYLSDNNPQAKQYAELTNVIQHADMVMKN